ncbi:MAG: phasin family protein [Acidiphilium sp.]|nr:phasin family protein [Acidiphilium sp.]
MAEQPKSKPTAAPGAYPFMPDFDFQKGFDFQKMFGAMKLPDMAGMETVVTAYRRNLEALSEANRVALEGAQAVARRHMEIMQRTMADMTEQLRTVDRHETPQARAAHQAELLKHAYETAVANMRDLGDLIQRSNQEAVEKLNRRFSQAMDEMKTIIDHKS